ncbi:PREDICTED: discoidin, CUB and LCCL domain-containing protein 2-like [Acropora digitifera]|uniref:discoidin, CUB and LCCL domain-containing protein 2-like n=1 Tax=Acropora digitifera TaxID=70779 RepID=UPI00077A2238|nr:PREDICTED: discoidin, CUB and LCCL domain-containing protein 2-like [Acropora digitifera]
MSGNHDGRSVVRHNFSSPMYARYIRVYPVAYRNKICMRMELYGCSNPLSALTTPPASTTQSAANETPPVNLPPGTRTTASTSTEKLRINQSTPACSSQSTTSPTTQSAANNTTTDNISPTTRATTASSTEKPITHSATDQPVGSDTTIIIVVVIVVVIAVVIIILLLWSCHRKRKRSERKSEEEVVELL